jgi:uncharacterized protein
MSGTARLVMFLVVVLSVWTLMHVYVFSRLWDLPMNPTRVYHRRLLIAAIILWFAFPVGQFVLSSAPRFALPLQITGAAWLGILFLLVVSLFVVDVITGFGYAFPAAVRPGRMLALAATATLSLVAFVQAARPPVVVEHSVSLPRLPPEHDGLVAVQISDLHLGPILREGWMGRRVDQIEALKPDLVFVTGDLVDQDSVAAKPLLPVLARLQPRLGVWSVTGNHEFYVGLREAVAINEAAGFRMLRDAWAEAAPGLIIAGVDDLTARRQLALENAALERALGPRPAGATIFLSHTPWQAERAAELGADLMLSGHTHGGQIWPFGYIVRLVYPRVAGVYDVDGMTLVVSRGTAFWGPPMRLFRRAQIIKLTLHAGAGTEPVRLGSHPEE